MPDSYQIELRHLRYFLAVAEDLHFRKAAERLYIAQPGLSRQIKQLEDELKVTLFERNNRNVQLTSRGKYLQKEFNQILKNLDMAIRHAQLMEQGDMGHLKIGYIGSAMRNVIPELLLKIQKQYPGIHFDLWELDNHHQIDELLKQELDIGFVRVDRAPKELEMRPVYEETFSLVLPLNHPINQNNFKNLNQLKEESFILFEPSYSQSYYEKVMRIFADNGFSPIISHNTVNAYTIYRLVENHLGVSIVPTSLQKGFNMKIKFIELNKIKQRTTLQLIWNKHNQNPILKNVLNLTNTAITDL